MKSLYTYGLRGGVLLGALAILLACGPAEATQPTPIAATAAPPANTSAPAATAVPTSAPAATSAPTSMPTAQPTAIPAATPTPQPAPQPTAVPAPAGALPKDVPWIYSAGLIFADDETYDPVKKGLPAPSYQIRVAPDGATVAYVSQQYHLIIADLQASQVIVDDQAGINVAGFAFAPDSRSLFFTTDDDRAGLIDLPSGQRRDLELGPERNLPNGMSTGVIPIAWTEQGLFAQQVLWGTDAPPQGIVQIDPATGAVKPIAQINHLGAALAPDGKQLALVTGSAPISEQPRTGITLLDLASGQTTPLVPEQPRLIKALNWSGDGTLILYASVATYETPDTLLQLAAVGAPDSMTKGTLTLDTYRDIAWGSTQPLLLSADKDGLLRLYWVEISDQGIISIAPSVAYAPPAAEQIDGNIMYTP